MSWSPTNSLSESFDEGAEDEGDAIRLMIRFDFDDFGSKKTKIWELASVLSKAHRWQQISKAKFWKRYLGKENKS